MMDKVFNCVCVCVCVFYSDTFSLKLQPVYFRLILDRHAESLLFKRFYWPRSEASNAEKASESAYRQVSTMLPGAPGYAALKMLGFVFEQSSNKEENFVKQIVELGYVLPISVSRARLQSTGKDMHFVGIRALCEHLAVNYPEKLLAGHTSVNKDKFHDELRKFWSAFRIYNGGHDVYSRWGHQLHLCIPAKFHMDEGTGQQKTAVQQWSWGPVIFASPSSLDRYMFFASMAAEQYKHAHRGYELGNVILDEVASLLADEARSLYLDGFHIDGIGRVRSVWVALEGDLPAQARAYHLKRNFGCLPNELCPWCLCNDRDVPHTDHRQGAIWRTTVHQRRPWTPLRPG